MNEEQKPRIEDEALARTFADVIFDQAIVTAGQLETSGVSDPETKKALEEGLALKLGKTALEYGKTFARRK